MTSLSGAGTGVATCCVGVSVAGISARQHA
ncbi:Uncharacterised protein [Bordetella pertussis]|nr:Uncharacterised protein [Bordetella pertussis]CFP67003.1 Uncharacterised protein [Bordetella pertussis]CFW39755.1 Uncharacterised protein [Bordetella pertussis]